MDTSSVFRPTGTSRWTPESIQKLSSDEIAQLRDNAVRLGADEVAVLCEAALAASSAARRKPLASASKRQARLVPRRAAFQMRGVALNSGMSSWGGVRQSDGTVVFSLWADDVREEQGGCSYLLWAPNEAGSRPWSDTPAGRERLQHCEMAVQHGRAEGLLVHGVREEGCLPEERARTIRGVDPAVVVAFTVVRRGAGYWAVWGGPSAATSLMPDEDRHVER